MASQVKMSDIAKELGVSTVTVSKALSGKDGVGFELRGTIKKKAGEMGYVYNSLPRNMLQGRNYNIGILIAARYLGETSFYWTFYQKLLESLKKTDYLGILEIVNEEDETQCAAPGFCDGNKVDGVILLGQLSDTYLTMITRKMPRCVFLDFYSEIGDADCVASNNFLGSYNLTKLLIDAGHKKIAFIGSTTATTSILDRYMGFCKAMLESGLPYDNAIEDRNARGYAIAIPLQLEKYTAYVCNNDKLAGDVIRQLRECAILVPEDISIVGFDNGSVATTAGVGVTSLEVNTAAMCDVALSYLVQHIENEQYTPRGRSFIDGKVIVKQSINKPNDQRM
ncbi:LacI family transcriptional regulator [Spirochaetia bacterium]|nr:LacI family transcriptional regulator [Spirochaetia bacterium]